MQRNQDVIEYISRFCYEHWTDLEKKAGEHYESQTKLLVHKDRDTRFGKLYRSKVSNDADVLELLKDGYTLFLERVANRIYDEHLDELKLNRCPSCLNIARTPTAQQCRFCGHNWR